MMNAKLVIIAGSVAVPAKGLRFLIFANFSIFI
jgi:hypothetical protein